MILGIFTADCVPILMVDTKRKIAGALHAGWRGVIADIAAAGVRAMLQLGAHASDIRAAMGPSIGPCCFEVDADLGDRFGREIAGAGNHINAGRPGKAFIDLRAVVRDQLDAQAWPPRISRASARARDAPPTGSSRAAPMAAEMTGLQMSFVGFAA